MVSLGDLPFWCWCLILSFILFTVAVVVNLLVDRKNDELRMTSFAALAAFIFGLVYIFGWWISDAGKLYRAVDDIGELKVKGMWKFGRFLYFPYAIAAIIGGWIPALEGGLIGQNADNSTLNQDFNPN